MLGFDTTGYRVGFALAASVRRRADEVELCSSAAGGGLDTSPPAVRVAVSRLGHARLSQARRTEIAPPMKRRGVAVRPRHRSPHQSRTAGQIHRLECVWAVMPKRHAAIAELGSIKP
jgi:hypothetical protein